MPFSKKQKKNYDGRTIHLHPAGRASRSDSGFTIGCVQDIFRFRSMKKREGFGSLVIARLWTIGKLTFP